MRQPRTHACTRRTARSRCAARRAASLPSLLRASTCTVDAATCHAATRRRKSTPRRHAAMREAAAACARTSSVHRGGLAPADASCVPRADAHRLRRRWATRREGEPLRAAEVDEVVVGEGGGAREVEVAVGEGGGARASWRLRREADGERPRRKARVGEARVSEAEERVGEPEGEGGEQREGEGGERREGEGGERRVSLVRLEGSLRGGESVGEPRAPLPSLGRSRVISP